MNEKAKFAVKTIQKYAKQNGFGNRNTSDISPFEEWLIIELLYAKTKTPNENSNIKFRTFGMIHEETGEFMVRIDRCQLFYGKTLQEATELSVNDYYENVRFEGF